MKGAQTISSEYKMLAKNVLDTAIFVVASFIPSQHCGKKL